VVNLITYQPLPHNHFGRISINKDASQLTVDTLKQYFYNFVEKHILSKNSIYNMKFVLLLFVCLTAIVVADEAENLKEWQAFKVKNFFFIFGSSSI
jgi:hypothetical protein